MKVRPLVLACLSCLLCLTLRCATAAIQVSPQDSRSADINAVFAREIPNEFLGWGADVSLQTISSKKMQHLAPDPAPGWQVIGLYTEGHRHHAYIYLLADQTQEQYRDTVAHEYGHFVWFQELTPDERADYRKIYQALSFVGMGPSDYWYSAPEEGAAEAFRLFIRHPEAQTPLEAEFWQSVRERLHALRLRQSAVNMAGQLSNTTPRP